MKKPHLIVIGILSILLITFIFYSNTRPNDILTNAKQAWVLTSIQNQNGLLNIRRPKEFRLLFDADGNVGILTDCNSGSGRYTAKKGRLSIEQMGVTAMYCNESDEYVFMSILKNVQTYTIEETPRAMLVLKSQEATLRFELGAFDH